MKIELWSGQVAQIDLQIPFSRWSVKQNSIVFFFPNRAELYGSWTVETEHNTAGFSLSTHEERLHGRESVHQ